MKKSYFKTKNFLRRDYILKNYLFYLNQLGLGSTNDKFPNFNSSKY